MRGPERSASSVTRSGGDMPQRRNPLDVSAAHFYVTRPFGGHPIPSCRARGPRDRFAQHGPTAMATPLSPAPQHRSTAAPGPRHIAHHSGGGGERYTG